MISRIDYKGLAWVDVRNPEAEDVVRLTKEFELSPGVAEDLLKPSLRPEVRSYGSYFYLVLHLPLFDAQNHSHRSRELDIVVGKKFLLTVHYDQIEPLTEFFKLCDLNIAFRESCFEDTAVKLFYMMWRELYRNLLGELDYVQQKVNQIEERIFSGREKKLIEDISLLRRDILDFSRSLRTHEPVLESLGGYGRDFFGTPFQSQVDELALHWRRIMTLIDNNKDTLETLYDTNNSLLTHRSSEVIKVFTMLALLTFPLTLIATIFSIDALSRPIVGRPHDFWIIIGLMILVVLGMLAFFKYRRWI
ncbi:MAG: CorA family divalent cation transporter [bacterium]|nr:CorA family divalent cation transporter [bacterium]